MASQSQELSFATAGKAVGAFSSPWLQKLVMFPETETREPARNWDPDTLKHLHWSPTSVC